MRLQDFISGFEPTKLLYLSDSYLRSCKAQILKAAVEKKKRVYMILDQTIFHPKGGGQPSDRGTLQTASCKVDIQKAMFQQGIVIHFGKVLQGTIDDGLVVEDIDWSKRYLFMKRHTAGHLLDHCLTHITGTPVVTTDSWLGEACYVGYQGSAPSRSQIVEATTLANNLIQEGRPVTIDTVNTQELLRRAPDAPNIYRLPDLDAYRIVTIHGGSSIPCAGTHIHDIQEIDSVTVSKIEQLDSGFRLYYDV